MRSSPNAPPLRIALLSDHASPLALLGSVDAGGQNVHVARVAQALAAAGHEVDVLTRRDAVGLPAIVELGPRLRVRHVDAGPPCFVPKESLLPSMPAFARGAAEILERHGPYDVLHAHFFLSGLVALQLQFPLQQRLQQRLQPRRKLPLVMTFHGLAAVRREHQGAADAFPAARGAIERQLVERADALVAQCPQDRDDLLHLYGADDERLSMVPGGVDLARFSPRARMQARHRLAWLDDDFIVLQVARMVPRKGLDTAVEALAALPASVQSRSRLVIVGGETAEPNEDRTPEIGRLRRLATRLGVADRVWFAGQRQHDALADCHAAADVFVTTPWYEPAGLAALEAMACARPVIASAVGALRHSVVDGITGHLVPPREPAALAQRLWQAYAHPEAARKMGRAGLQRVRARFSWDRVAAQLAHVYRSVQSPATPLGVDRALPAALQAGSAERRASATRAGLRA